MRVNEGTLDHVRCARVGVLRRGARIRAADRHGGLAAWARRSITLADSLGQLHQQASQPSYSDHAGERRASRAALDVRGRPRLRASETSSRRRPSPSTATCTSPDSTTTRGRSMAAPARSSGTTSGSCPSDLRVCCGMVNRGFAVSGDRLFMTTLDAHVMAIDRKTGTPIWDVPMI